MFSREGEVGNGDLDEMWRGSYSLKGEYEIFWKEGEREDSLLFV
jgi:hypothetical protein